MFSRRDFTKKVIQIHRREPLFLLFNANLTQNGGTRYFELIIYN